MLLFSSIKDSPLPQMVAFPDHLDEHRLYYLPEGTGLSETSTGDRDFFLLRYRGDFSAVAGGLLHMQLEFKALATELLDDLQAKGWRIHPVSFSVGRFRLGVRSMLEGATEQVGAWHEVLLGSEEVLASMVSLTPHETELLQGSLEDGRSVVEIDLDLRYRGLVPGMPWLVTAQTAALKTKLAPLLGNGSIRSDQVVAAFLSLPDLQDGSLNWQPLESDIAASQETILTEVAFRSLEVFFQKEPTPPLEIPHYHLLPASNTDPSTFSWDLISPRQEERSLVISWSISELYQELTDLEERRKYFPVVSQVNPFEQVSIYVVNHLPFDANYLQEVQVDLRFTGPTGVPTYKSYTFTGEKEIVSFTTIYPALTNTFQLDYRITATLAPLTGDGWTTLWKRDFATADGLVVEVSRKTADIDFVQVEAELQAFEKVDSIEVTLLLAGEHASESSDPPTPLVRLLLNRDKPTSWVALPGNDPDSQLHVRCLASPLGGVTAPPYTLFDGPLPSREVKIAAYQLEVLEPDRITISLDPETAPHFAYVAVSLAPITAAETDEGKLYTLSPDKPRTWTIFRNSVFDSIRFRYRITYVAFDDSRHTLPMTSTIWSVAEGTLLTVRPPVNAQEVRS